MANPPETSAEAREDLLLDRYFSAVWRAKWFILGLILAAAGVTAFVGYRQPELHTSTALIEVGRVWKEPLEDLYTTAEIVNSAAFAQEVGNRIVARTARVHRALRAEVVTGGTRRTSYPILVRITTTDEVADEAMRVSQAVADAVTERHAKLFDDAISERLGRQHRIEQRIEELNSAPAAVNRELMLKLESELDEVKASNVSPTLTQKTHLVGPIAVGITPAPSRWRSAAAAALIALIAGIAIAVLAGHFKTLDSERAADKQGHHDASNS